MGKPNLGHRAEHRHRVGRHGRCTSAGTSAGTRPRARTRSAGRRQVGHEIGQRIALTGLQAEQLVDRGGRRAWNEVIENATATTAARPCRRLRHRRSSLRHRRGERVEVVGQQRTARGNIGRCPGGGQGRHARGGRLQVGKRIDQRLGLPRGARGHNPCWRWCRRGCRSAKQVGEWVAARQRRARIGHAGGATARRGPRRQARAARPGCLARNAGRCSGIDRRTPAHDGARLLVDGLFVDHFEQVAADSHLVVVHERCRLAPRQRLAAHDDRVRAAHVLDEVAAVADADFGVLARNVALGVGQGQRVVVRAAHTAAFGIEMRRDRLGQRMVVE